MLMHMRLAENSDGSFDLVVNFDSDTEFGLDFLKRENQKDFWGHVAAFIRRNGRGLKIRSVKLVASGVLLGSLLFSSADALAAMGGKYTMAYFNGGTAAQHINWVEQTDGALDMVSPSYFDLNADGTLKVKTISSGFVQQMHTRGIKVVPYLSNHWNKAMGNAAVNNYDMLATQVAQAIDTYNLDGINVDIENVGAEYRMQYTALVAALRAKISPEKEISVAVAANPNGWTTGWHGSYDYEALGRYADHLIIMAYDEHWEGGAAGPVASLSFVERSVKYALKYVPANKVVVSLPLFGRIWGGNGLMNGKGLTLNRAEQLRAMYNGTVNYDKTSNSPVLTFTVKEDDPKTAINGITLTPGYYTVWYENDQSLQQKVNLLNTYDLKGAGTWALGGEPDWFWDNYRSWLTGSSTTPTPDPAPTPPVATQNGWVKEGNSWRYYEAGHAVTGWKKVGSRWYHMNASGIMQTGWQQIDGQWYYMNASGAMMTGWQRVNNRWYYMKSSGVMQTGWVKVGSRWYYMNTSGVMQTGWQRVNNRWYYMNASGVMQTGWLKLGSRWYYLNASGVMLTGTQRIGGKTYRFNSSGVWLK